MSGRGDEFDQLAEVINDMLDRIGRLMDGVRQVSNAIAHDLRTPITRARARLEEAALHADTPEAICAPRSSGPRPTSTASSPCSRPCCASPKSRPAPAALRSPGSTWRRCWPMSRSCTVRWPRSKGLTWRLDRRRDVPAYGDAALIQQAVANLLDNAVKFSPRARHGHLARGDRRHAGSITVTDQGPGIPEEERARATERFYRGETARSTPGSGLGLALVQAVAHLHGGDVAPGGQCSPDCVRYWRCRRRKRRRLTSGCHRSLHHRSRLC